MKFLTEKRTSFQGGIIGGSNRISAVREAFKYQFASKFIKSNEQTTSTVKQNEPSMEPRNMPRPAPVPMPSANMPPPAPLPVPPPRSGSDLYNPEDSVTETKRKRKSRWEWNGLTYPFILIKIFTIFAFKFVDVHQ